MDHETLLGCLVWVVVLYPIWSPRCRRIRRNKRRAERRAERQPAGATRSTRVQTGPKWEQDVPYPECFTDEGDDLDGG